MSKILIVEDEEAIAEFGTGLSGTERVHRRGCK